MFFVSLFIIVYDTVVCDFEAAQMADRPNLKRPPMPRLCPPSKSARTFSLEAYIAGEEPQSPSQRVYFDDDYYGDSVFSSDFDTIDNVASGPDAPETSSTTAPLAAAPAAASTAVPPPLSPGDLMNGEDMTYSSTNFYPEPESPNGLFFP